MADYQREVAAILERERAWQEQHRPVRGSVPAPLEMNRVIRAMAPRITPDNFSCFTYSKHPHFAFFRDHGVALHGHPPDPTRCDLKVYQDLLVYSFIKDNVPAGARVLGVGGGGSRVVQALRQGYEFLEPDKLESGGN